MGILLNSSPTDEYFGAITQYPDAHGSISGTQEFVAKMNAAEVKVAVGADILSLVLLKSPGFFGVLMLYLELRNDLACQWDTVVHSAAFFATKEAFKRNIPGRIIGVSVDADNNTAMRMALQTREQHIKRGKATSNICTAQALLAVMASM